MGTCVLRCPDLSLINVGYRFARTLGPRSGRLWPVVAQEFRWIRVIAATSHLQNLPAFGRRGSLPEMLRVEHMGATGSRAARVIQWMRQRQVAVQNVGDFLHSSSALDVRCWTSGKCRNSWLGVEDTHEICRVDLHPSLVEDVQEEFRNA